MNNKESLIEKFERLSRYEKEAVAIGFPCCAGIDEAGRGPLAGPVVAAACILDFDGIPILGLDDSKKLSEKKREELFQKITLLAKAYSIERVESETIDEINILEATKLAMRRCVESLPFVPSLLLIDAVRLENVSVPVKAIIRGDANSNSIAAASILAKVTRDRIMTEYATAYPVYGFEKHKGYGTKAHYEAIDRWGMCPIHRKTFLKKYSV